MTTVRITLDEITPLLKRLQKLGRDSTPMMRAMGTTFKSITEGNFSGLGAAYRPTPWAPRQDPAGPSNLTRKGDLRKAFHLAVTPTTATLSNAKIYGPIHQFGGVIRAKPGKTLAWKSSSGKMVFRKKVTIPARPFFPVQAGTLTPAAQEKILAAARRSVEKAAHP